MSPEAQQVSSSMSTEDASTSIQGMPTTRAVMPSPPRTPHPLENDSTTASPITTSIQDVPAEKVALLGPPGSPRSSGSESPLASFTCSPVNRSHPMDATVTKEMEQEEASSDMPHWESSVQTRKEVVATLVRNYLYRDGRGRYLGPAKVKEKVRPHRQCGCV